MSQLPSANQTPHTAAASDAPAAEPGFEVLAHAFCVKNRNLIYTGFAVILLALIGRAGWQYFTAAHELSVQEDYAKAADQPDRLAAFAEANSGHALAGVAYLQLADLRYAAADYTQAVTLYNKAAGNLKNEALLGRARLGAGVVGTGAGLWIEAEPVAEEPASEEAKALGADKVVDIKVDITPEDGIWTLRRLLGWRSAEASGPLGPAAAPSRRASVRPPQGVPRGPRLVGGRSPACARGPRGDRPRW